jgi:hypothetical protein
MRGFEESYADIIDYIIRCTWRIWEGRGIDLIRTHYAEDCPVHTMTGTVRGIEPVIAGTRAVLAAFPDRTLVGEAVIWSGDDELGYLSSHRITSHATHLGPNEYGQPTGRRIDFTTIADCFCRENLIVEEWLVRDHAAIVRKLGLDVCALARSQAAADQAEGPCGMAAGSDAGDPRSLRRRCANPCDAGCRGGPTGFRPRLVFGDAVRLCGRSGGALLRAVRAGLASGRTVGAGA